MAIVKPFKGLRTPNQEVCEELACLPYDVMNSEEAAQMAAGKPKSLPCRNGYPLGRSLQ